MKNNQINIWLPGQPARVTHQSGTRYTRCGNRTYKTKALLEWEERLKAALEEFAPGQPIEGPIELRVAFGYKPTRKADLWKWKLTKPDTDNSIKTLKDVMTGLGFWHDDAQVSVEQCKKMWVDEPGILIQIEELDQATKGEWRNVSR